MDKKIAKLEGHEYCGRFLAEEKNEAYRYRGDTHHRNNYWWGGQGIIKAKQTGKSVRFLFETSPLSKYVPSLEHALINFQSRCVSYPPRPVIKDYAALVDLVLEPLYTYCASLPDDEDTIIERPIIPSVTILPLDIEILKQLDLIR